MVKGNFKFYKKPNNEWWLILPKWKGNPEDLQMIEGADKWLDLLSNNQISVTLLLTDKKNQNAEVLTLLRLREENLGGGGIYFLETYQGQKINLKLWLCEVTRFVFQKIPQKIYFKVI